MSKRNIPLFKVFMSDEAVTEASRVLKSGFIGQGAEVDKFEEHLARKLKNPQVVTTNSGTSALHLVLKLLEDEGLSPGAEVLTTPLTCFATNSPLILAKLNLKWVDVDPRTFNIDLDDLERKITERTRAIVLIHWGGYPIDMKRVEEIRSRAYKAYGTYPHIIQDCAHAFGTTCDGLPVSNFGDYSFYSLQAIKHITSVDGGVLVCNDDQVAYDEAKLLRWYGIDREGERTDFRCEQDIILAGTKWHMNDVCAAIGNANLSHLDDILSRHRSNANYYYNTLLTVGLPPLPRAGNIPAWWLFTLNVERRDDFIKAMLDRGIVTSRVHERNDKHFCTRHFQADLPGVDQAVSNMVCIPVGWWVTEEDREYIVDSIRKGW